MNLAEHPTVRRFHENQSHHPAEPNSPVDADWLRQLCLDCGADDAGLVEIGRPALDDQRGDILRYFPLARTLLSFVCRMNRGPIRSPARSASNLEFHGTYDHSNEVARKVVAALEERGVRAMNPSAGFPMEQDRFPGKIWVTFTGKEPKEATVTIRDGTLQVRDGHQDEADLRVTADSETWLGFLAKERSLLWALLRRKIRIKGSPKLLVAFGKCFPS